MRHTVTLQGFNPKAYMSARAEAIYRTIQRRIAPTLRFNQSVYEDILVKSMPSSAVWLDAGCGWKVLPEWATEAENALIERARMAIGCDLDLPAMSKHRSIYRRTACNLSELPFKSNSLDLITLNMVMEHVERPAEMLMEFARALKPGGRLIVHTPFRWSYFALLAAIASDHWKRRIRPDERESEDYYPVQYRCNTPWTMRRLCHSAGLSEIQTSMVASDAVCQIMSESWLGRLLLRLELYWIRLSLHAAFRYLRVTMCAVYLKQP